MSTGPRTDGLPFLTVGERLDRLPVMARHWKIFWLLAAGLLHRQHRSLHGWGRGCSIAARPLVDAAIERPLSVLHLPGPVDRGIRHGVHGGSLRPPLRVPIQSSAVRARVVCSRRGSFHDVADLISICDGVGPWRGNRIGVPTLIEFIPARHRGRFISLFIILEL